MRTQEHNHPGPITYQANLNRTPIFEAETSVKNAHTASHLRILDNKLVFVCIDETVHIYSLTRIAENKAPLVNIIALTAVFE